MTPARAQHSGPRGGVNLFSAGLLGVLKGALIAAFVIVPFVGIIAGAVFALIFGGVVMWLTSRWKTWGGVVLSEQKDIVQGTTCYPKVKR